MGINRLFHRVETTTWLELGVFAIQWFFSSSFSTSSWLIPVMSPSFDDLAWVRIFKMTLQRGWCKVVSLSICTLLKISRCRVWNGTRIKIVATVVNHLNLRRRNYELGQVLKSALVASTISVSVLGLIAVLNGLEISCLALWYLSWLAKTYSQVHRDVLIHMNNHKVYWKII